MRGSEVFRSLIGGCLVYALTLACSSGAGDGGSVDGSDTGGVTGMNGNGGSSGGQLGSGSVANAATGGDSATGGDQGTGGDAVGCECPVAEPDQFFERPCDQTANNSTWATLTVTGASVDDLMLVTARFFDDDGDPVTGFAGAESAMATAMAFSDGEVKAQCVGVARFRVPASLASTVQ